MAPGPRTAVGHLEVLAADLAAAERFYVEGLGFAVTDRQGPPGGPPSALWLAAGPLAVLLRRGRPGPRATSHAEAGLAPVIYTDDVPALLARLSRLGVAPVGDDGPGCPLVRDPDGTWWQVVDPRAHGVAF